MKQKTKVNPYEKKKTNKKRITRKQLIVGYILLAVLAIIVALAIFGPKNNSSADPHAGHNHAPGEGHDDETTTTVNAHAGHNHAAGEECDATTTSVAGHSHNENQVAGELNYRVYTNADKTYRLTVMGANNKVVYEKDKLTSSPYKEELSEDVFTLAWATGQGPNDYQQIFCNNKTGAVSSLFNAPRGYDNSRIAYPNDTQTKIIVQDIFDKNVYLKEYTLPNAYISGEDTIIAGRMNDEDKTVAVSYYTDAEGKTQQMLINLYE